MSLGGITDYLRANNISIPQDSSAGTYLPYANQGPYEDIMARMRASGGRGGSGGVYGGGGTTGGAGTGGAMGGYDPNLYKRFAPTQTAGSAMMDEILPRDRGTKGGMTAEEINDPERFVNFNDAQKASYFANNPIRGAVANALEGALGYTTYGMLEKLVAPEYVEKKRLIGMGINPTATSEITTGNTAQDPMQMQELARQLGLLETPVSDAVIPRYDVNVGSGFTPVATTSPVTKYPGLGLDLPSFDNYSNEGRNTLPAGYAGGFAPVAAPVVAAPAERAIRPFTMDYDSGTYDTFGNKYDSEGRQVENRFGDPVSGARGDYARITSGGGGDGGGGYNTQGGGSSGFGGSQVTAGSMTSTAPNQGPGYAKPGYAKGGPVSMSRLQGPNPAGPDDGYATLKSGEFVINDKAVKKYGIELMNAINSGKISKGKLRGLLEM